MVVFLARDWTFIKIQRGVNMTLIWKGLGSACEFMRLKEWCPRSQGLIKHQATSFKSSLCLLAIILIPVGNDDNSAVPDNAHCKIPLACSSHTSKCE